MSSFNASDSPRALMVRGERCVPVAALVAVFLLIALPIAACVWDRDSLVDELEGETAELDTILGRFDVFPPRYYKMRIARVERELREWPQRLNLYDDIAVAHDRIGDSDGAIEWMARKRDILTANVFEEDTKFEHQYRYLANLGTFYAHRWASAEESKRDDADLREARDLIAAAIELNPNAHYGREAYQLAAIEWLRLTSDPEMAEQVRELQMPPRLSTNRSRTVPDDWHANPEYLYSIYGVALGMDLGTPDDARRGFLGLIRLGAARESIDIFAALGGAYAAQQDSSLYQLVWLRLKELGANGRRSFLHIPHNPDTLEYYGDFGMDIMLGSVPDLYKSRLERYFKKARKEAESWRLKRLKYLEEMFERGEHPDTHPEVWAGAPDSDFWRPWMPINPGPDYVSRWVQWVLFAAIAVLSAIIIGRRLRRARS